MKGRTAFRMSSNWTRRTRWAAALVPLLLLSACGGDDSNPNRIKPIQATLTIDPFLNSPDPAVYFLKDPKNPSFPDLEIVQVRMYTAISPVTFDAYTVEIHFDPSVVQVGNVFEYDPGILGGCNSGNTCAPLCSVNSEVNSTGSLIVGVAAPNGCPATTLSTDSMLLRIGFIAQTTIPDSPAGDIDFIEGPGTGDCEILMGLSDLAIPFEDGNARMTASR
jgi:hypothetical protein